MTITRITCGDLAALGGRWDRLYQHHPRDLGPSDTLCHCYPNWMEATRRCASAGVHCRDVTRIPVGEEYVLILCCLCAPRFQDALRGVRDRALHEWLAAQCGAAVVYREQRKLRPARARPEPEVAGVAR